MIASLCARWNAPHGGKSGRCCRAMSRKKPLKYNLCRPQPWVRANDGSVMSPYAPRCQTPGPGPDSQRPGLDRASKPALEILTSPGRPLDPDTRAVMEPRFGHDFSRVRVHSDVEAARAAGALSAQAFARGSDIVFGAGRFRPDTLEGRRLIAHELVHVVQQRRGTRSWIAGGASQDDCEQHAQRGR